MGKRLIIKGADFSANAIYSDNIEWTDIAMAKGFIVSNPSSSAFGEISTTTTSANYKKLARLASTIAIPNGKKLVIRVANSSDEFKKGYFTTLRYQTAWSGSSIPSEALPAVSVYHGSEQYVSKYEYTNNSGSTIYLQACVGVEGVTTLNVSNYKCKYYLE